VKTEGGAINNIYAVYSTLWKATGPGSIHVHGKYVFLSSV